MARSTSEQTGMRIKEIAKALFEGKKLNQLEAMYGPKWNLSKRSIKRYISFAKEECQRMAEQQETARLKAIEEAEKDRVAKMYLSKEEVLEIATNIARGEETIEEIVGYKAIKIETGFKYEIVKGTRKPNTREKREALDLICRVNGWMAPVKKAETDTDGKDKPVERKQLVLKIVKNVRQDKKAAANG